MNRTVIFQTYWNTLAVERRQNGVSDISERGVEREREMVNPEWSWSGVIIKCSERRGEIVNAPLRSHNSAGHRHINVAFC